MIDPLSQLLNSPPPPHTSVVPLVQRGEHPEGSAQSRGRGPNGGDLDKHRPEFRTSEHRPVPMDDGTLGLHRHDVAKTGIKNEQPWHRMAAYMLLNRRTNSEIAAAAGVTPAQVSTLRGQMWFQQLLSTLENEAGDAYTSLVHGEAIASLQKVIAIRDSSDSERLALQAAQWIAEQAHGKAVQKTISTVTHRTDVSPQDEMSEIEQELANLQRAQQLTKPTVNLGVENQPDRMVGQPQQNSVVSRTDVVE